MASEMESEMERRRSWEDDAAACKNNAYAQVFNSSAAIAGGGICTCRYLMY